MHKFENHSDKDQHGISTASTNIFIPHCTIADFLPFKEKKMHVDTIIPTGEQASGGMSSTPENKFPFCSSLWTLVQVTVYGDFHPLIWKNFQWHY